MTTPFSELAMRIAEDITGDWFLCVSLPEEQSKYIEKYFKPTNKERGVYNMNFYSVWLDDWDEDNQYNNSFRILILLMAEQHWLEYENE